MGSGEFGFGLLIGLIVFTLALGLIIYPDAQKKYDFRVEVCENGYTLHYVSSASFGVIHSVSKAELFEMASELNFTQIYSTRNVGYYIFNGTEAWSYMP